MVDIVSRPLLTVYVTGVTYTVSWFVRWFDTDLLYFCDMENNTDDEVIGFYEREFYTFSNFSSFAIEWRGRLWMTSEHAYQAAKFDDSTIQEEIRNARSAHDSKKLAEKYQEKIRSNWSEVRLEIMEEILLVKLAQHPYVMKKLLQTGERMLVEDSWRDAYWGWGPNKDGENHLGRLWMKIRDELEK